MNSENHRVIDFNIDLEHNDIYDYITNIFDTENISYNPDALLLLCDQSWRIIARYKGLDPVTDDYMPYFSQICELTMAYHNNSMYNLRILKGEEVITSVSEGGNSISFASHLIEIGDDGLTDAVRATLLPSKYFKVFG